MRKIEIKTDKKILELSYEELWERADNTEIVLEEIMYLNAIIDKTIFIYQKLNTFSDRLGKKKGKKREKK